MHRPQPHRPEDLSDLVKLLDLKGNKRLSIATAALFLELKGYRVTTTNASIALPSGSEAKPFESLGVDRDHARREADLELCLLTGGGRPHSPRVSPSTLRSALRCDRLPQCLHEIVSAFGGADRSAKRCACAGRQDVYQTATSAFSVSPVEREYRANGQALVSLILSSNGGLLHRLHGLGTARRTRPQFARRCDEGAIGTLSLAHDKFHRSQGVAPTEHRGAPTVPNRDAPAVAHP